MDYLKLIGGTMRSLTLEIKQDELAESPRQWDNLGKMVCFHGQYDLGDKHTLSIEQAKALYEKTVKQGVALPLYLYDHSGITMSTSPFSCPWDSGQVGFIYADKEMILKMFGKERMGKGMKQTALDSLQKEVEIYDQYLTGDVYFYTIKDEAGEVIDSCGGFFGEEDAKSEGASALKYLNENEAEEIEAAKKIMAL